MPKITGFLKSLLLYSALIYLAGFILFSTVLSEYYLPVFNILILYFSLLSVLGRILVAKSDMEKPGDFNNRYFLARWSKMLLHLVFIVVYLMNIRENLLAFVIVFMGCYLLYSIFDIYTLNVYLKKK